MSLVLTLTQQRVREPRSRLVLCKLLNSFSANNLRYRVQPGDETGVIFPVARQTLQCDCILMQLESVVVALIAILYYLYPVSIGVFFVAPCRALPVVVCAGVESELPLALWP